VKTRAWSIRAFWPLEEQAERYKKDRFMDEQLVLDFSHVPGLDAGDFLIGDANREAARLVHAWPNWPSHACLISGPAGAGKSHLANVWSKIAGAPIYLGAKVAENIVAPLTGEHSIAVEDVDRGPLDERALFHLLNLAREKRFTVLLTARSLPGEWNIALPDLRSRFRSLVVVQIAQAGDDLLKAVLIKQFSDRQLRVPPEVIDYIAYRMERSMAAAGEVVALLDRTALTSRRRITRQLAAEVLNTLGRNAEEEENATEDNE
jgi:chromosomal replication initiation ATPase DnaA